MNASDRKENRKAEAKIPERIKNLHCSNCDGEVEIGSLYSPGRGNSRVYLSIEDRTSSESPELPVLAVVCRECGQISLMIDRFEDEE